MSFLLKSMQQFNYLSNKDRENFFLSEDDDDDDFDFKYVPAVQFKNVVKNVRRQKVKMSDQRTWESFVKQQESLEGSDAMMNNFEPGAMSYMKEFFRENIGNVDRELKRLEEDAMPEINKIYKSVDGVEQAEFQPTIRTQKRSPIMKETGTGSSNILLAIPEEQNSNSTYRKVCKPKSKRLNNTRKSSSDHAVVRKDHTRKLLRAMDDSEYNSSPEASPDRISDKEFEYFTRPDPLVVQKVLAIQKKVSSILDEISYRLERIPLPDGDRDLSRRLQRVSEFSVRFSRNYLYDLGRQVADMQQHIRVISPDVRPKPARRCFAFHLNAVSHKLINAHQLLLQALSAYCKHIPSSIVRGNPGKLKEILQYVTDLKDICNKVNITSENYGCGDADTQPFTKETHRKCAQILSKLQVKSVASDNESQIMSHTTQSTVAAAPSARSRKRGNQKRLSSRLSMYSIEANGPKLHPSRRPSTCFPREKKYANTNSRFLNYNRTKTPKQPNPSPVTVKSPSKEIIRNCPPRVRVPPREDDIRTMMDMMPAADSDLGSSVETVPMNRYSNINAIHSKSQYHRQIATRQQVPSSYRITSKEPRKVKSNKKVTDDEELTRKVTTITEERLSSLVPVIADLMSVVTSKQNDFEIRPVSSASMETLLEFLQKYHPSQHEIKKPTSPKTECPKEVRSGSKNMQLICMPYNEENDRESKCSDFPEINLEAVSEASVIPPEETTLRLTASNNEANSTMQLVAPVSTEFIIPEYHRRYQSFIQGSPMYLSNTNNKPWDVVAWIADKLVDELIAEISKELQMDNIIKKMFDLEFEEF